MPSQPIACTFFRDSHDRIGQRVETTWDALVARCTRHDEGTKDGPALACATFSGPRGNASLIERSLIALDIEANPTTGEVPIDVTSTLVYLQAHRVRSAIWTTHSHTIDAPRYRILLPLSAPVPYQPDVDPFLSAAAAAQLRIHGVSDPSKFGAASLFYLPRHHPDSNVYLARDVEGDPVDTGYLLTMATTMTQRVAQDEADVAARRRANALPPEIVAVIEAYNVAHAIPDSLARYGYQRNGNRWRSRYQHGQGATTVLPDGRQWVSFSATDADNGVGTRPARASSQCSCWGDSFALYVHYEHNNNFRRALAALGGTNA